MLGDDSFLLEENTITKVNVSDSYYYQIQCQLFVTKKNYCDFFVWTTKDWHFERISIDKEFCNEMIDYILYIFYIYIYIFYIFIYLYIFIYIYIYIYIMYLLYIYIFFFFFELTFYYLCRDRFGEDLGNFIFENWSCFLDDCETLLEETQLLKTLKQR